MIYSTTKEANQIDQLQDILCDMENSICELDGMIDTLMLTAPSKHIDDQIQRALYAIASTSEAQCIELKGLRSKALPASCTHGENLTQKESLTESQETAI